MCIKLRGVYTEAKALWFGSPHHCPPRVPAEKSSTSGGPEKTPWLREALFDLLAVRLLHPLDVQSVLLPLCLGLACRRPSADKSFNVKVLGVQHEASVPPRPPSTGLSCRETIVGRQLQVLLISSTASASNCKRSARLALPSRSRRRRSIVLPSSDLLTDEFYRVLPQQHTSKIHMHVKLMWWCVWIID